MSKIIFEGNEFILEKNDLNDINKEILKELIVSNVFQENETTVSIHIEDFYNLDSFYIRSLGFYPFFEGFSKVLFIDKGGLTHRDSRLKIEFYEEVNSLGDGHRIDAKISGYFIKYSTGETEIVSKEVYHLISLIDEYNICIDRSANNKGYELISNIQKLCTNEKILLDSFLQKQEIDLPQQIKISVEVDDENDTITLKPEIERDGYDWFPSKILKGRTKHKYTDVSNHKSSRVVFGSSNENVLAEIEKIKVKPSYTGTEVKKLLEQPNNFFDSEIVNLSELLSERVLGMQLFAPHAIPVALKYDNEWIPGFKLDEKTYLTVNNSFDYLRLKEAYQFSISENDRTVYFKGKRFRIENVKSIINVSKIIFEDKEILTEEEIKDELKEGLIVKDNVEELLYISPTNIENLDSFELYKIGNLNTEFKLKDHQREGISFLQSNYFKKVTPGVLLADDMGLGKTLQILYFLESVAHHQRKMKPVLIICPSSLIENWNEEYSKFFKQLSFNINVITGRKINLLNDISKVKQSEIGNIPLILTTYETLRINALKFCAIEWSVVILDEAQKIKNPNALVTHSTKALETEFKIALTGTPVENSLNDLWCIMDFCVPGILGSILEFNKKLRLSDFNPREAIENFFIRRLKKDVAKDLPVKKELKIKEKMFGEQLSLYESTLSQLQVLKDNDLLKGSVVLRAIHELRNIVDHPLLANDNLSFIEEDLFSSAKMKITFDLLKEIKSKDEKVIVFTDKRKMQYILKQAIQNIFNLEVNIVNGDVPSLSNENSTKLSRHKLVDDFQSKEGFNIIIMSPIAAGFGLNVTSANHVIHYTRHWNPAKEQQATDRAYRIGQEKDVSVYYPISIINDEINSFDEIIDRMLERKKKISEDIMFPSEKIEITNEEIIKEII